MQHMNPLHSPSITKAYILQENQHVQLRLWITRRIGHHTDCICVVQLLFRYFLSLGGLLQDIVPKQFDTLKTRLTLVIPP